MTVETIEAPKAPAAAVFMLDLDANGGVFAPTTGRELMDWIEKERQFWSWFSNTQAGNHRGAIDQCLAPLHNAVNSAQQALQYEMSSPESFRQYAAQAQSFLNDAYINRKLPHSASILGKRIEHIRQRGPQEALAYVFTFIPNQGYQFDARDIDSWRGFLEGMSERYGVATIPKEAFDAALASVEDMQAKIERLMNEKTAAFGELHRHYEKLATDIRATDETQRNTFGEFLQQNQITHDTALDEHKNAMGNLEKTFREKMALRAPVEYWEGRQQHHSRRSTIMGSVAFGAMTVLAGVIGLIAYWVLSNLQDGKPEAWRVAVLGLIGVLGVWAVRLVVRMFLSDMHLATDAGERVTMVKTYLSLLEGEKLPSDDDRKLILQALFRPATDGIVKDEGLPHPALEALTRIGGR